MKVCKICGRIGGDHKTCTGVKITPKRDIELVELFANKEEGVKYGFALISEGGE